MTGLYNRMTAKAKIDQALRQEQTYSSALFMLDIDNFKQINDTYGHTYGDAVLSEVASKLEKIFRQQDLLSRLGGDEFLVFLENIPEDLALSKAQQICERLRTVYSSSGRYCEISCSVGVAFSPRHGSSFEELYDKADTALYHSKNQGKNRYSVYQDGLTKINLGLRQPAEPGTRVGKVFSQNIVEYIFKILYYSEDLELAVTSVLELLCKHYSASRGYFIEYMPKERSYTMRYEWCAPGLKPGKDEVKDISEEQIGNIQVNMTEGGIFVIEDMEKSQSGFGQGGVPTGRAGCALLRFGCGRRISGLHRCGRS